MATNNGGGTKQQRRVNWMLVCICMFLASSILTFVTILWDINQRAKEREAQQLVNEYIGCVIKYALGVREIDDVCRKYEEWIKKNTNVRIP